MIGGLVTVLAGVGLMLLGLRELRPRPAELEEFVTGHAPPDRPVFLEAAGPVLGVIAIIAGVLLLAGGLLYLLIAVT